LKRLDAVFREPQAGCSFLAEDGLARQRELRPPRQAARRNQYRDLAERQNGSGSQRRGAR
jgi:hypothetical protein